MAGRHCLLFAVLLAAPSARASGFATARFGGEHGHPTTTNPTAVYYNPAAMTASQGTHLFVDGMFAARHTHYTHQPAPTDVPTPADGRGANSGQASLTNFAAVPMLGATTRLGDLALGAGVYLPFGGEETWDQNEAFEDHPAYPGPVDGVQRWYDIAGKIQSFYFTLGAAYPIGETGLSLGVSGNLIYSLIHTTTARTVLADDNLATEGRSRVDVSGWQASFGVGALWEALRGKLWLGASYQARPNVAGGMVLKGDLSQNYTGSVDVTPVDLHQDLPDVIRLGLRYRPEPTLELRLFGDVTRWSAFEDQCVSQRDQSCDVNADGSTASSGVIQNVRRDWNDAFGVRAGMSSWVKPELEVFTGAGYDSNAVPDATLEPSLLDFHDVSFALGARYELAPQLFLAGSFTQFLNVPRDTQGKSEHPTLQSPSNGPDSGGRYTEWVSLVNLNVEMVF